MFIRSLGIFLLLLIQFVKSFDEEDNVQLANMIDYIITIDVLNREHFGLGGMVVSAKYGQQLIADKEITDAKGQFIKKGKWAQSSSYNVEIDVGTQFDNNARQQSFQGNVQDGVVSISGKITFDSSDFQTSDPQRKCQIQVNTFVVGSTQKVPNANINFSIGYNSNNQMNLIKFSGISDQNGYLITRFWIPTQVAIVFYECGMNGYWNDVQHDPNNQKFILFAQNKYSLSFDSMLSSGVFKYILKGRALDEKTNKPLEGVEVVFGGKNLILNQEITEQKFKTKSDGIFQLEQDLQIYHKYSLIWNLNKDKYQEQAKRYEFDIDLDKKEQSEATNDLGMIKMLQALGQLTISGTITDSSKLIKQVQDATIELSLGQNSQPYSTKTDKNGQYQLLIHTPIDEKIIIQISVQAKGFAKKLSDKKEITVYENKPATLSINVELDRVKVPIKINDKIIDEKTNQVVPQTKVKIISSDPQIKDSTYYNKEVQDNADGTVQLNFECYENMNFKVTLQYYVPLYVPYTYTTPSLECKNQDLGSTPIKLAKMTAVMNLKGDVKDINLKTVKDFEFTISSEPSLQFPNNKIKSGSDGSWSIQSIIIIPETTYQLHATYINIVKDNTVVSFKYVATTDKTQNVQFPTINVEALIKATISGTISTPEGPIPFPLPIQIKCDSKGKDGKPISIQTKSGSDGKFTQQVEMVGSSNVEDVCHVASGTTQIVKPFDQQVKVGSPKWAVDSKVSATYNSFDITISGKVTDKSGISKSMEGVDITLTITPMDPLIPAQKTHVLELFLRKQQFLDQKTSQLSTKSSKDGAYKLIFKVVQGIELTGELTASLSGFDKFDKKGIKIAATKSETITQDIELNRETFAINLHSTLLDTNKKPVPKATIAIGKTNPLIKDSPSYNKPVKDQDNGNFIIPLSCFKDIEYVATFKVDVPTFMEQNLDSEKFKCSQKDIQLSPLSIKLEKVMLMAIVSGKVLNPFGKGQSNLDLKFITKPDSAQLQAKTTADGTWTINDPKIVPNQQYEADVTYTDYKKQQQEVDQKFEIQSANQKITFKDIMYSDTVKAKIEGTIKLEKGTISSPVTMELLCPKTSNQLKETKLEFKSDKTGKISESFDIVATFKEIIKCQLTPKDVIEPKPVNVELQQPKYEVQIQIQGKLQSQKVTISGILKDHTKISSALPNVPITLTLKPVDQLADSLQTKSGQDSKYKLEFEIAKGQEYDATLTVDYPPQFKKNDQTFKISGKTDLIAITKDVDLERIIVDCNIVSSLAGSWNPEAKVEITSSIPLMDNKGLYNKPVTTTQGAFSIPFQCYNSRETTLQMDMWSDVYPKTSLPPQDFECGPKIVKLKPIQVKSDSVQITLSGTVTDKTEIVTGVPQVEITIELTPKDPLASSLTTKTDDNGKYSLIFGAVKNFSYKMIVKFTNPGFQEYKSQQITIDTSKSNQVSQNAELDRIILNPNVHVILNDDQSKPLAAPEVTVTSLYPPVKGHESDKISGKGNNSGQVALKLFCYKEVDETMILNVQVPKYKDAKTNSLQFKCDKTDITVPPTKVKLEKAPTATVLTIKGQVLNPDGKGQQNINIHVTTNPGTEELTSTTGADGKFTMKSNEKLLLKTKYMLILSFNNADGSKNEVKHEFQTEKETSELDMGQINYADFRKITISGVMQTSTNVPAGLTSIQATSTAISKDKKPLQAETLTDQQGRFNFQFDLLVESKKTSKILLQNEASGRYTSQKTEVDVIPPKYEYSNQKVVVKATQEYQDQLDQYYKQLEINGQVIGQFSCNNNQQTLGIEGVKIIAKQWNGLSYSDMNLDTTSDQNGYFKFVTTILKSKLPNEIQLEFLKDNYINKLIYLNAYSFQGETENKIVASLPPTLMTYLKGLAPCPTSTHE